MTTHDWTTEIVARCGRNQVRSGFFTSRPASKASDRALWAREHAASALAVIAGCDVDAELEEALAATDAAVGVHQHHDAVCVGGDVNERSSPSLPWTTGVDPTRDDLHCYVLNYLTRGSCRCLELILPPLLKTMWR